MGMIPVLPGMGDNDASIGSSAGKQSEGKHNMPLLPTPAQIDTKLVYQMPGKILIDGYNRFVILVPESEEVHW